MYSLTDYRDRILETRISGFKDLEDLIGLG